MTSSRKAELIYIALAFTQAVNALTWVQILYNEPASLRSKTFGEWMVLLVISFIVVAGQTLTTWKAYLSDPKKGQPPSPPETPK